MSPTIRIVVSLLLLAVAAYCGFGFLATFEPPGFVGWRIGFAVGIVLSLGGVAWLCFAKRRRIPQGGGPGR
jgi:hypothetical protein